MPQGDRLKRSARRDRGGARLEPRAARRRHRAWRLAADPHHPGSAGPTARPRARSARGAGAQRYLGAPGWRDGGRGGRVRGRLDERGGRDKAAHGPLPRAMGAAGTREQGQAMRRGFPKGGRVARGAWGCEVVPWCGGAVVRWCGGAAVLHRRGALRGDPSRLDAQALLGTWGARRCREGGRPVQVGAQAAPLEGSRSRWSDSPLARRAQLSEWAGAQAAPLEGSREKEPHGARPEGNLCLQGEGAELLDVLREVPPWEGIPHERRRATAGAAAAPKRERVMAVLAGAGAWPRMPARICKEHTGEGGFPLMGAPCWEGRPSCRQVIRCARL
jgi:hypothetical protein